MPLQKEVLVDALGGQLKASAEKLIDDGIIGIAARIDMPALPEPMKIVAGHRELERSTPIDGSELYSIASQSKSFAAAVIVVLAKQGKLSLTDEIGRYVPDVPAVDPAATIEQFLNHTSGIGNFLYAIPLLPYPMPTFSYDDIMALARAQGRQFAPGARFDYNNTDSVVLTHVAEIVTGRPFGELLQELIFDPVGMSESFVASEDVGRRRGMAKGYYQPGQGYDGQPIDVSTLPDFSVASAAGNIVSSLADMQRWAASLSASRSPANLSLGDMAANVVEATHNPNWFFPPAYGRGVERWRWGGRDFWGHRGSFFGYHSATFLDEVSGGAFSMFMTMNTQGSFFSFVERQAAAYMALLEQCGRTIAMLSDR